MPRIAKTNRQGLTMLICHVNEEWWASGSVVEMRR
jgi:hypothetical protein